MNFFVVIGVFIIVYAIEVNGDFSGDFDIEKDEGEV